MLNKFTKFAAVLALAALPITSLGDWLANLTITARTTNNVYADTTQIGARADATANFDANRDVIDSPANQTSVNTYQELTNSVNHLYRNYLGTNDAPVYRGVIEYNGIAPTSTVASVNGLPRNDLLLLTFSDSNYTNRTGAYQLSNGTTLDLKTNTIRYVVAPSPIIKGMDLAKSGTNATIRAAFPCGRKLKTLDIRAASSVSGPYTNQVGKLNEVSDGNYESAIGFPASVKFFRTEISDATK